MFWQNFGLQTGLDTMSQWNQMWWTSPMPSTNISYPWLSSDESQRLQQVVSSIPDPIEKKKKEQQLYEQVLSAKKIKDQEELKQNQNNQATFNKTQSTDPKVIATNDALVKMNVLSSSLREYAKQNWIDTSKKTDRELISSYIQSYWSDGTAKLQSYMNWQDTSLLDWLSASSQQAQQTQPQNQQWWWDFKLWSQQDVNVIWWAYDTVTWAAKFLWWITAEWIGWLAKQFGADPVKVAQKVQEYKDIQESMSWKAMWADENSTAYKITKWVWDVAQLVAPVWAVWEAANLVWKWAKMLWESEKLAQVVWKWAKMFWAWEKFAEAAWKVWQFVVEKWVKWAADTALYTAQSEQRMPTKWELAMWAGINTAIAWVGKWIQAIRKTLSEVWIDESTKTALKTLQQPEYKDIVKAWEARMSNIANSSPLNKEADRIETMYSKYVEPKLKEWGSKLWSIREDFMNRTWLGKKEIVNDFSNGVLKNVWLWVDKSWKIIPIPWLAIEPASNELSAINNIRSQIKNITKAKQPLSAAWVDSLIKSIHNNYAALWKNESSAKKFITDFVSWLQDKLNSVVDESFPAAKQEYSKLAKIREFVTKSEWKKWVSMLKSLFWEWNPEAVDMLNKIDELAWWKANIIQRAEAARFVMTALRDKAWFESLWIPRPSKMWLIKWWLWALEKLAPDALKQSEKFTQWYVEPAKKWVEKFMMSSDVWKIRRIGTAKALTNSNQQ